MIDIEAFDECLRDIENGDPAQRKTGIAKLVSFPDARSLEVARVLLKDGDPEIKLQATRVFDILREKGIKPRPGKMEALHVEIESLNSANQVLDEVFFLYRSNLDSIFYNSMVTGIPKIFLFGALGIYYNYFENLYVRFDNAPFLGLLVLCLLHVILLRPLIWEKVGRSILGGFSDLVSRSMARIPFNFNQYFGMLKANLFETLILAIPALFALLNPGSSGAFIVAILLWVFLGYFLVPLLPCRLMFGGGVAATVEKTYSLYRRRKDIIKTSFASFLVLLSAFYIVFFMNFCIGFEKMFYPVGTTATLMGLLLADIILDPFWIAYRILVARLMVQE